MERVGNELILCVLKELKMLIKAFGVAGHY